MGPRQTPDPCECTAGSEYRNQSITLSCITQVKGHQALFFSTFLRKIDQRRTDRQRA